MEYRVHGFRYGDYLAMNVEEYRPCWEEVDQVLRSVSEEEYSANGSIFRLDFAKGPVSVEVAFNHGNDAPWNLLKPTLASELNHVEKAIQTDIGIIITATDSMRVAGGFDNAVGTFEKYVDFLRPMGMLLTAPLVIVGLEAPRTFHVEHRADGRRRLGYIVRHLPI